jgi:hypothetical protein
VGSQGKTNGGESISWPVEICLHAKRTCSSIWMALGKLFKVSTIKFPSVKWGE